VRLEAGGAALLAGERRRWWQCTGRVGGEEGVEIFFNIKIFGFLNITDKWGPHPAQQMILCFRHVIPTGGPDMSEIVSIYVYTVICSNCKKSPLEW
jgi:hypothetical protein